LHSSRLAQDLFLQLQLGDLLAQPAQSSRSSALIDSASSRWPASARFAAVTQFRSVS
jgi:hypothetical protein